MLYVPANAYERRSYSVTLYLTSFTLDFLLALTICAQRKTRGLCFTSGPKACVFCFVCLYILGRDGRRTYTSGPTSGHRIIRTVLSTNRVDLGSFSSRCCTFRRTHTSADSIRLLCIRLALPLSLSLPSRLAPSARLAVGVPPRALWLAGIFLRRKKICAGVVGTRIDWVLKGERGGMTIPLLQYFARFDRGDDIVGFGGGGYKKSRPWCSLLASFPSRGVVAVCTRICSQ